MNKQPKLIPANKPLDDLNIDGLAEIFEFYSKGNVHKIILDAYFSFSKLAIESGDAGIFADELYAIELLYKAFEKMEK